MRLKWLVQFEKSVLCLSRSRAFIPAPFMRNFPGEGQEGNRKDSQKLFQGTFFLPHFKFQVNMNLLISAASSVNTKHGWFMSLSQTDVLMGPQEENKIFNKIKCDKWTLGAKQGTFVRAADTAEGQRGSESRKEAEVETRLDFEILTFFFLNWRDLTILHIIWCTAHVHISSLLAIPLSLLICCSQSRVPYYVNQGMRQMVPQSNEFIWGEGFNYGWVGPAVFWVQQTSQTLWAWQNPRCRFPGTFKNLCHICRGLTLGIELSLS